jgi:hypothetical protein
LPALAGGAASSARDLLDGLLHDSQQRNYQVTAGLRAVLEQFVDALRFAGQSCDVVIAEVDQAVRVVQPTFRLLADDAWKASWDAYFEWYDLLIQRAVISYFVNADTEKRPG